MKNKPRFIKKDFKLNGGWKQRFDLVFLLNTLHHFELAGGWRAFLAHIYPRAQTGIFIKEPVYVRGLPERFNKDYDGRKFLVITEMREIKETNQPYVIPLSTAQDILKLFDENARITEEEFSKNHQEDKAQPNILTLFFPGKKLRPNEARLPL